MYIYINNGENAGRKIDVGTDESICDWIYKNHSKLHI